jgi:hypothetical protein
MPFVQPTLGNAIGLRDSNTILFGSLAPIITPGFQTRIGADIAAEPPLGTFSTFVAAGFNAGSASPGDSMIFVSVAGTATTSRALVLTAGAYAHAHAELSISIEEWTRPRSSKRFHVPARLVSRVTFNPTKIFDDWGLVISYQLRIDDGTPFSSTAGMPISPTAVQQSHTFVCWINLIQLAECAAITGYAQAISNVQYDFVPPFFAFL